MPPKTPSRGSGPPDPDSVRGRRRAARQHLAALYADIPPRRRAAFMKRAETVLMKILEDSDPEDTRYDASGRIARLGTSKRDRAAIVKDALSGFKLLGEVYRDGTEQHIAVTKLIHGVFTKDATQSAPQAPTINIVYHPQATPPDEPNDSAEQAADVGTSDDPT